jgi:hypothetical protein
MSKGEGRREKKRRRQKKKMSPKIRILNLACDKRRPS